ncbi:MAG: Fic family protein [Cytophagales bacterium]|nr:Fic family protein [Cytophagales bacterium]
MILVTSEILALITELDEFKGKWQVLNTLAPDHLADLKKVATIESIGSSTRIEGSKLSDEEVDRLLSGLETKSFQSRDEQEVAGYADTMNQIFLSWNMVPFTENYIKQFHSMLLRYSEKDQWHKGEYKKNANHVEAFDSQGKSLGVIFETASPFETPNKMADLVDWTNTMLEEGTLHTLFVIAIFTVEFLAIHPFQDGNGRLSRVLTTLLLLRAGYQYVPYSSLEYVIEMNKDNYYLALRQSQKTLKTGKPDYQPWLMFFFQSLKAQKQRLEKRIGSAEKFYNALPALSETILKLFGHHRRLSTGEIERQTGESRATIKKRLGELVQAGYLVRHGKGRSTWYSLAARNPIGSTTQY